MSRSIGVVSRFVRKMRGKSQPFLAEASDGFSYVVKFRIPSDSPNSLFNEVLGTELYHQAKLPIPPWRRLWLTQQFIDANPSCWVKTSQGFITPQSGPCFGSRFLGNESNQLFEILPGNLFLHVLNREDFWLSWLLDVCAGHSDNRQALFVQGSDRKLTALFIDHGHMFGGPYGSHRPHFLRSRYYLDPRIYPDVSLKLLRKFRLTAESLDTDKLWRHVAHLPDEWKTLSALQNLKECLDTLTDAHLIEAIAQKLIDSQSDADKSLIHRGNKPPNSFLRLGIPRGRMARPTVA